MTKYITITLFIAILAIKCIGTGVKEKGTTSDIGFEIGTYVLENATDRQCIERMTSFTLYSKGIAVFNPAIISSYMPPKCAYSFEDNELVFRAIIESEWDRSFYGLDDNSIAAKFSVIDDNTLLFIFEEIPLFAERDGLYVLNRETA